MLTLLFALHAAASAVSPDVAPAAEDLQISITSAGQTSPGVIPEPANCFGPLSPLSLLVTLTNLTAAAQATSLSVTVDPGWTIIPDSCVANSGACTIQDPSNLTWSGTLDAFSSVGVLFGLRVDSDVPAGTALCLTLVAQFGDGLPITVRACQTTNSARQCGLGAPAMHARNLVVLGCLLLLSGIVVLRRRSG